MNAAHQRRLTPLLAATAVLLAAALLLLLSGVGRGVHWGTARAPTPLPPVGHAADLPTPQSRDQFALIWQKPLFSPDRKPVAHAADGGSNLGDLELTGIILTPGLRIALLHNKADNTELRLRQGESLPDGSVTLVEVRTRSALFDSAAGRTELKLPAGAPIDRPGSGGPGPGEPTNQAFGNAMMPVRAGGQGMQKTDVRRTHSIQPAPANAPPPSALERLRQNIQKRRAARAAAANEGER